MSLPQEPEQKEAEINNEYTPVDKQSEELKSAGGNHNENERVEAILQAHNVHKEKKLDELGQVLLLFLCSILLMLMIIVIRNTERPVFYKHSENVLIPPGESYQRLKK